MSFNPNNDTLIQLGYDVAYNETECEIMQVWEYNENESIEKVMEGLI